VDLWRNPKNRKGSLTCPPKTDPHVKLEWWIEGRQEDEQEALYPGADPWKAAGSRGVSLAQGQTAAQVCRTLGIAEQTFYRWRREYGGLKVEQAKRLKALEQENARLRRAVSDLTLDKLILQEAVRGNF
jgi:putative transposase